MFSVMPLLQGNGIGKMLLRAAEQYCSNMKLQSITMTVISTRFELISWYENKGYINTGEILPFHVDKKFGIPRYELSLVVLEKKSTDRVEL